MSIMFRLVRSSNVWQRIEPTSVNGARISVKLLEDRAVDGWRYNDGVERSL
jgi:hypothetical protein